MWAKLSFRLKITVIFSLCLTILTVALTALTLVNLRQSITMPMHEYMNVFSGFVYPDSSFIMENITISLPDLDRNSLPLTEEQLEEIISHFPDGVLDGIINPSYLQEQLNMSQLDFRHYSFWIAGLIIIFGSIGAYLVAGIIVKPIKKLSTSISEVESNKLDRQLPPSRNQDEISQLTDSFNGMLNKLHRSFESKQLFAQNASHELKTPLAIIRADLEVLKMTHNPTIDDYEEVIVEIENNAERMIGLVEGLLEMGNSPKVADLIDFEIREVVESIFYDLEGEIKSKQLNVNVIGDFIITAEKILFRQALFNLISNAIRYNVIGGSVVVSIENNQITIEDTGVGIPPDSLERLFDPFYCVDKSRSKKLGGNGLGLAIAKNILDNHHMGIDIHSQVGLGTTITIKV